MTLPTDHNWEKLYDALGVRDIFDFITSSAIQGPLLPIKILFWAFGIFFFVMVIYLYINSSYLRYQFLQDANEFFSWKASAGQELSRRWRLIERRISSGLEKDFKVAIVEADDILKQMLQEAEFKGTTMEQLVASAGKKVISNTEQILQAHQIRNAIVHDVNYRLDVTGARKILADYEKAIKNFAS